MVQTQFKLFPLSSVPGRRFSTPYIKMQGPIGWTNTRPKCIAEPGPIWRHMAAQNHRRGPSSFSPVSWTSGRGCKRQLHLPVGHHWPQLPIQGVIGDLSLILCEIHHHQQLFSPNKNFSQKKKIHKKKTLFTLLLLSLKTCFTKKLFSQLFFSQ